MIIIHVDEEFEQFVPRDEIERAASTALDACLDERAALTVVVTGEEELHGLNAQHRGIDKPTDVLSFPTDYIDPDLDMKYVGDVLISFPTARSQAEEEGHEIAGELQLLVVHGVLHLVGYDHLEKSDQEEMAALQRGILDQLGLDLDIKGW